MNNWKVITIGKGLNEGDIGIYDFDTKEYLWCDGTIHPARTLEKLGIKDENHTIAMWRTREEAKQFLENWKMSQNYLMIDGNRVEISEETAKNLRKQFCEERYYPGDKFIWSGNNRTYVLCKQPNGEWFLMSETDGWHLCGSMKRDVHRDGDRVYITELPAYRDTQKELRRV